jgi:hypothetical protein
VCSIIQYTKLATALFAVYKGYVCGSGRGGIAPPFLTSILDGGERSASRPGLLTPGTHCWVGPGAHLDSVENRKIYPLQRIEPRPSGPSLYRLSYRKEFKNTVSPL